MPISPPALWLGMNWKTSFHSRLRKVCVDWIGRLSGSQGGYRDKVVMIFTLQHTFHPFHSPRFTDLATEAVFPSLFTGSIVPHTMNLHRRSTQTFFADDPKPCNTDTSTKKYQNLLTPQQFAEDWHDNANGETLRIMFLILFVPESC